MSYNEWGDAGSRTPSNRVTAGSPHPWYVTVDGLGVEPKHNFLIREVRTTGAHRHGGSVLPLHHAPRMWGTAGFEPASLRRCKGRDRTFDTRINSPLFCH